MKARRILCTIAMLFFLQQGYAQTNSSSFTIKGTLTGPHVDSVTLNYEASNGKYEQITNVVVNNGFTITGTIAHPVSCRIMFKKKEEIISRQKEYARTREFYIDPAVMTITGNSENVKTLFMTGSKTQTEFDKLERKVAPILLEEESLGAKYARSNEEYINAVKDKKPTSLLDSLKYIVAGIHDEFEPYNARVKKATYQFFVDYPNSYVTLDRMRYYASDMSLDSTKAVYNAFNAKLKATPEAKELMDKIKRIEAGTPGAVAALFTKTDLNGKTLSLADFKGKYVMLDFWASWCVPCRKSNPHMIELYNRYKGKGFDVIGIADDDGKPATWKAAVDQDKVGIWHNVLRGIDWNMVRKKIPNPNDLDQQYGIASIPTKILIGPDGKILGRYGDSQGGTEEDMDKMLASIFDK